ncbi:D-cysteine desulfhydrase [Rosenbergiella collisarenosi]|uniref:D-cysteine desulfhydrase n=1 Tax=Rosenbergiella collisarenosi TaxID=1544695 RepID=UPI001BD9B04A|nr:D-cysteine desulfhydrase [Rosenbergiella collisarenosi]MBT0722309.1 D-cysteine desulfhydrase [Rosenbergiella collisarenosi]
MLIDNYPKIELVGAPTPIEYLPRLSDYAERDIYIKRDDLTPLGLGGNKLRKLEFLAAEALQEGADVLVTAGAVQSNHVRQTAAVAAKLGLKCMAILENPLQEASDNYLKNGNRLLLDLLGVNVQAAQIGQSLTEQLAAQAELLQAQGFRPYIIPVGGSNLLGSLGYIGCAQEIAHQVEDIPDLAAVVVASGSGGTHAGLSVGLEHYLPQVPLVGVTVSRDVAQQLSVVDTLRQSVAQALGVTLKQPLELWDDFYAPGYGYTNDSGNDALNLLAQLEGIFLDPVYTAKAMAGLLTGISTQRFAQDGPLLFIHTGGSPALFAYS